MVSKVPFSFDAAALADASQLEHEHYALPSFDGFSDAVADYPQNPSRVITDIELHRTYLDALTDLHHLVDEYRFSALLAVTLLRDYRIKCDRSEVAPVKLSGDEQLRRMPVPAEVIVVMKRYSRQPPSADELFDNPHQQIAGGRILSRWFAGQLIDSALYRGIAACDRLAILLRCQAGLSVTMTKSGEPRQPTFSRHALTQMKGSYPEASALTALIALTGNPLLDFVRQERNGFTHSRRSPSELHGESAIVYGSQGPGEESVVGVMDGETHYLLAPAFYNEVLVKALDGTRAVIVESSRK